ncbi:hypothetical protein THASP1DRAFT_13322 [Thamnocephalis sphaerospora]|uniref:Uncharacterized protein n=1 Tax=Thamnocephalis sphaerospora TaxID=78915 RepID=A0A4P9XV12_9FUNG|nr:hypothetical protein THASP1DRAFT_13322 [Thamnocephalis sphaerospora]|eukprot:RKP10097.1 hypothetical protein THASP1DRAFT_13322 [Thamnocephalis sphaerospora]
MCCSTAKWKREVVQDHKFDFVDVEVFRDGSPILRIKYGVLFILVIKAILIYSLDVGTAYQLITNTNLFGTNKDTGKKNIGIVIDANVRKWLYVVSIVASFSLLLWEWRKGRRIIRSRDIAYSYTNVVAYRFYSIRSYSHFCFFAQIGVTEHLWNRIAFFVYFTLKGWKRMIFADGPRQFLNALTLWDLMFPNGQFDWRPLLPNGAADFAKRAAFFTTTLSFCLWALSAILTAIACILYVPLLCNIRGNLKEYVCHKIDKR